MDFTITFIKLFFTIIVLSSPILVSLCAFIVALGLVVGRREGWSIFNTIYWTFITALTVGYGDMRPLKPLSKILAVAIAWTGIMFSGVIVAATVGATTSAIKEHIEPAELHAVQEKFK